MAVAVGGRCWYVNRLKVETVGFWLVGWVFKKRRCDDRMGRMNAYFFDYDFLVLQTEHIVTIVNWI